MGFKGTACVNKQKECKLHKHIEQARERKGLGLSFLKLINQVYFKWKRSRRQVSVPVIDILVKAIIETGVFDKKETRNQSGLTTKKKGLVSNH